MSKTVITRTGARVEAEDQEVPALVAAGGHVEGDQERAATVIKEQQLANVPVGDAIGLSGADGLTFGGSSALIRATGGEDAARYMRTAREAHPTVSAVSEIAGGLVLGGPVGRIGSAVGGLVKGAGTAAKIGRAAVAGAVEGQLYGAGVGIGELARSEGPITGERAISSLSSHTLYGGGIGGVAGGLGKAAELGLRRAKGALDEFVTTAETRGAAGGVADDLAAMDVKGLRAAEKLELEGIAAARETSKKTIVDELAALKTQIKSTEQFATTKGLKLAAREGAETAAELGRRGVTADRQLAKLLDNPVGLAQRPERALDALQRQEQVYMKMMDRADDFKSSFAVDSMGGKRAAAFEAVPQLLEKNRAIQKSIAEITSAPTSSRLSAIQEAREVLSTAGRGTPGIGEQLASGSAFGLVADAVRMIPLPGMGLLAPLLGARASNLVSGVSGRLGKAAGEAAVRSAKAVSKFLEPAAKVTRVAPPLATRVLTRVRFSDDEETSKPKNLAEAFAARSSELRGQTQYGPDGTPIMRPEARQALADRLAPIGVVDPQLADEMETIAARRIEFLAAKLPRRPDIGGLPLGGKDRWQPSEMEQRQFAAYVDAVEDPVGVIERLGDGVITPEAGEVMREVYPEMHAQIVQDITMRLPELRESLPWHKRLSLSIFSDVPVDPSLQPHILRGLQAQFSTEEGTEGGTQGPKAAAQFGSVSAKNDVEPTAAQSRAG